jgi:hypothetical protein
LADNAPLNKQFNKQLFWIFLLNLTVSDKIAAIVIIGIHCGQNNTSFLSRSYKFNKNIQKSCLLNCLFKGALSADLMTIRQTPQTMSIINKMTSIT